MPVYKAVMDEARYSGLMTRKNCQQYYRPAGNVTKEEEL